MIKLILHLFVVSFERTGQSLVTFPPVLVRDDPPRFSPAFWTNQISMDCRKILTLVDMCMSSSFPFAGMYLGYTDNARSKIDSLFAFLDTPNIDVLSQNRNRVC